MFHALRARMGKREEGFSLIELMIVVLIIAILIAIAIPTFLGARTKSQDRAAQVVLRQALLTSKSFYTDSESFNSTDNGTTNDLQDLEPTLEFDSTIGNADKDVVGYAAADDEVVFVHQSQSGTWFCIAETEPGGTTYGKTATTPHGYTNAASCSGGW